MGDHSRSPTWKGAGFYCFWFSLSAFSPSSVRHRQRLLENPLGKSQLGNRLKNLVGKNQANQTKNLAVAQMGQTNQVSQTKSQERSQAKSQERSQEKNQAKSLASQLENLAASQANQAKSLARSQGKSQLESRAASQASLERNQAKNQAKNQVKNQVAQRSQVGQTNQVESQVVGTSQVESQVVETSHLGSQARNNQKERHAPRQHMNGQL